MSSFTNPSIQPKGDKRIVTQPMRYYLGEYDSNEWIDVPVWFEFDGASVPKLLRVFIERIEPRTLASACIHDYLYTYKLYKRWKCDKIFLESLLIAWNGKIKSYIMYIWVYLFWRIRYDN